MTFRHPQSPEVPDRRRPRRCRTRPHPVSRRETFPRAVGLARRGSRPWRFCAGCAASPRGITPGRRSIRTPCGTAKRAKGRKVSGDVAGQRTRRFFFSEAGFEKVSNERLDSFGVRVGKNDGTKFESETGPGPWGSLPEACRSPGKRRIALRSPWRDRGDRISDTSCAFACLFPRARHTCGRSPWSDRIYPPPLELATAPRKIQKVFNTTSGSPSRTLLLQPPGQTPSPPHARRSPLVGRRSCPRAPWV